ncbi:MAG: hypothetical protein G5663_05085 [Serratia symbiotica]|nr:hypothetical protein [Serratia symbiotica]
MPDSLITMVILHRGYKLTYLGKTLCDAHFSVGRWVNLFTLGCYEGTEAMLKILDLLVHRFSQDFGYLRSRWNTEILTIEMNKLFNSTLHPVSLRRWLTNAGIVWRRAALNLYILEPNKGEKTGGYRYRIEE